MATNPYHVPNASLAQAYLGPAVNPRAQTSLRTAATQFHHSPGHVVSPGMLGIDGRSWPQEGPTMMVRFNI